MEPVGSNNEPDLNESIESQGVPFDDKRLYCGVFLTAMLVIFYEVVAFQTLIFVTNYMKAVQILAIALIGIAAGGLLAFALRRRASVAFFTVVALLIPLAVAIGFASLCLFPDSPWIYSICLMLPFICCSLILSMIFTLAPPHRVYFFDLTGAAVGAVLTCISVPLVREEGSFLLIMLLGFMVALVFSFPASGPSPKKLRVGAVLGIWAIIAVFSTNMAFDYLNLVRIVQKSPDKHKVFTRYHKWKKTPKSKKNQSFKILESKGSLVERIDFIRLSKRWVQVIYNGYSNDHFTPKSEKRFTRDVRLPKGLVKDPDVLIIGTAAEGVCKPAKVLGNGKVVGLEINPPIVKLMQGKYYKKSNYAYKDIEVHTIDARSYLKRTDRKFDIITMMNTHRIRNIGHAGQPEYLHTAESLSDVFDHLTDRGWLILEERNVSEQAELGIFRFISNARWVLKEKVGAAQPAKHFWVYNWYGLNIKQAHRKYTQIFIKKTPINGQDLEWIHSYTQNQNDSVTKKNKRSTLTTQYTPDKKYNNKISSLILAEDPYQVVSKKNFNFSVITDDRPFPFDAKRKRPHLWMILTPTVTLAVLIGLLPAMVLIGQSARKRKEQASKFPPAGWGFGVAAIAYFAILGLAYLMMEVVLIQRLQHFIGKPVLTFAAVVGSMLLFSGLGSLASSKWAPKRIFAAFAGIVACGLILFGSLGWIIDTLIVLPEALRVMATVILVAPLAFLMGAPFPYGIGIVKERLGDRYGAAMFGLNGAFSALATPIALAVGMIVGFSAAFYTGVLLYLPCLLLAVLMIRRAGSKGA